MSFTHPSSHDALVDKFTERSTAGELIRELSIEVWRNSHSVDFGQCTQWDEKLFLTKWAKKRTINEPNGPWTTWSKYFEGWYWFLVEGTPTGHSRLARPYSLPINGCDIGSVATENFQTFGAQLICTEAIDGKTVVYNGHEKRVRNRVRSHFSLGNDRTGALGIRHFPLHEARWELRIFGHPCLNALPLAHRSMVERLMLSKSGRNAIESAWRGVYGWPLLCKK